MIGDFLSASGNYLLGAGASAGDVPVDPMKPLVLRYLREAGSFPILPTKHTFLDLLAIEFGRNVSNEDVWPDRPLRPGTLAEDYGWRLQRIPSLFVRRATMAALAEAGWRRRRTHSYTVFRAFYPSLIFSYNHDGLAVALCGRRHRVYDLHHTVPSAYGSPMATRILTSLADVHLPTEPDGIPLFEPEAWHHRRIVDAFSDAERHRAEFIAIIGYSFWRRGDGHLDQLSLNWLQTRLRTFRGSVYVIDPHSDYVCGLVENASRGARVIYVPAYWNVLAHAIVQRVRNEGSKPARSIYEDLLDQFGGPISFPIHRS